MFARMIDRLSGSALGSRLALSVLILWLGLASAVVGSAWAIVLGLVHLVRWLWLSRHADHLVMPTHRSSLLRRILLVGRPGHASPSTATRRVAWLPSLALRLLPPIRQNGLLGHNKSYIVQ